MNFRNEEGSITVYVLVAVFFLLAIIAGRFVIANRNLKVQYDALAKVKAVYENNDKQYPIEGEETDPDNPDVPDVPEVTGPVDHEIYIFNKDAFNFFNNPSGRFYVYQVDIWYIADDSQSKSETKNREISLKDTENYKFKYKLMSDITVNSNKISENYSYSVANSAVCRNLDFNNHIIYVMEKLSEWKEKDDVVTGTEIIETYQVVYGEFYVFSDKGTPSIGSIEGSIKNVTEERRTKI